MQKIIEYRVTNEATLASSSLREFVDLTSTDAPVPGGGSVAALCGSLAAALTAMVANLTFGKKGYESVSSEMSALAVQAQSLKDEFLSAVDDDARAFDAVMMANRLPKGTHDEQARRDEAIQIATQHAIDVPLSVMRLAERTLPLVERVAQKGNKNSISDAGVAALVLGAACQGAWLNVLINLPGLSHRDHATQFQKDGSAIVRRVSGEASRIAQDVAKSLA